MTLFGLAIAVTALAAILFMISQEDKPVAPRVLVEYTRRAGFAGTTQNLVVYEDRSAVYSRGIDGSREFKLSAKTMQRLERFLPPAAEILARRSQSEEMCADCIKYALTFEGAHYLNFNLQMPRAAKMAFAVLHEGICQGFSPGAGWCTIPKPFSRFLPPGHC
ncbi:MAG: hypothetical protein ACRDJB_10070 [Actinomycetota bacterium]